MFKKHDTLVMIVLCKYAARCVYSMCSQSLSAQHHVSHSRATQVVLILPILSNYRVYPQPENEEKLVVYNNIGPNVCMGDHKVTKRTASLSISVCLSCLNGSVLNNIHILQLGM